MRVRLVGFGGLGLLVAVACGGESTKRAPGDGVGSSGGTGGSGATGTTSGTGASGGGGGGSTRSGATGSGGISANGSGGSGVACGDGGCIEPGDDRDPIEPPGPVYCGGVECGGGEVCCLADQECFDPKEDPDACAEPSPDDDTWGRKPCTSNAHCGDKEFCSIDQGCSGTGHCHPISNCGGCSSEGDGCRVCGCDGNTYPDVQTACLARTGTVPVRAAACGETVTEGDEEGRGGASGTTRELTPCGNDAHCPEGQLCCAFSRLCYAEDTPYLCEEPPEGTTAPCLTDADCRLDEYCWGESCDAPGGCVRVGDKADDCGVTLEPVCGCDGTSYTSAACADERGVRVASEGECADGE